MRKRLQLCSRWNGTEVIRYDVAEMPKAKRIKELAAMALRARCEQPRIQLKLDTLPVVYISQPLHLILARESARWRTKRKSA